MIVKRFELFTESYNGSVKNIVSDICIGMILLNNTFLDSLLDRGQKARYSENSKIFLNDLKNLLFGNNRLKFGKFTNDICVIDDEISKLNTFFNSTDFNIEKDWNELINARITARNIQDKLLYDEKLTSDKIKYVYWLGPNKNKDYPEDLVIELQDSSQYSFYLNKKLQSSKTVSFNTIMDTLIEEKSDRLFSEDYINKWDKLTQEFVRITYENSTKPIQKHISNYIEPDRIGSLTWKDYHKQKHLSKDYQFLGEFIPEFNKNILKLSELLGEIWKEEETYISDTGRNEWDELKLILLNSKIIEHLFINSFNSIETEKGEKLENGFIRAVGKIKMRLMRLIVEQLGATERNVYYLNNSGNEFYRVPSKDWFRKNYDRFDIEYDLHTELVSTNDNNYNFKIKFRLDNDVLIEMNLITKFSSTEMSGKLSTKVLLDIAEDFNFRTL
jgi:hypothetical protein